MIKNEKQYKIIRKKLLTLQEEITHLQTPVHSLAPAKQLILSSMIDMKTLLEEDIAAYEKLISHNIGILTSRNIADLPNLIIEYKIASGMTQKEFSEKIGMKEQQLQRYEAEGFSSISFKNLLRIIKAIGLDITIQDTPIQKIKV
jgi:HTH-type transcriptional regulator/antitoxin HigA